MKPLWMIPAACTLFAIGVIDGALKFLALRAFPPETDPSLSHIFALALHKNPGITFDINLPLPITLVATCTIITAIVLHLPKTLSTQPLVGIGFVAIVVGALNNMVDRIAHGFTTDYLMIFHTSVLNLSDLLILFGAIVTLVYYKTNPHSRRT